MVIGGKRGTRNMLGIFLMLFCIGTVQNESFITLEGKTLPELCQMFGIFGANCTCANLPDGFCDFIKTSNTSKDRTVTFKCLSDDNTARGAMIFAGGIIGIMGNSIVIIVNIHNWKTANHCQKLITYLAIADFFFGLIQCVIGIPLLWTCKWQYGLAMCKILRSFLNLSSLITMGFIVIIAIERYLGIVYPLNRSFTSTKINILIALNIVVGIAGIVPALYYLEMGRFNTCIETMSEHGSLIYSWFLFTAYFLVPIVIISFLYGSVIKTLYSTMSMNIPNMLDDGYIQKRKQENQRVFVILLTVLVAFFLLILPNRIIWVVIDHIGINNLSKSTYRTLKILALTPYTLHVAINPIIYSIIDKKFRKNVSLFFGCNKLKREHSNSNVHSTVRINITNERFVLNGTEEATQM